MIWIVSRRNKHKCVPHSIWALWPGVAVAVSEATDIDAAAVFYCDFLAAVGKVSNEGARCYFDSCDGIGFSENGLILYHYRAFERS